LINPQHDTPLIDLPSPVVQRWLKENNIAPRTKDNVVTAGEWTDRKLKSVYDVDKKEKL
jgi:hypothetical protein